MSNWADQMWDSAMKQAEDIHRAIDNPVTIEDIHAAFVNAVNVAIVQNEIITMLRGAIEKHRDEFPDEALCGELELWESLDKINEIVLNNEINNVKKG